MHSIGAVLVKPENSKYAYYFAESAAMNYNTCPHYTDVYLQNVDVKKMFDICNVASLKVLYEVGDISGIVNDIADKYYDEFLFPSAPAAFSPVTFAYILTDPSNRINIDKIIDIDGQHCDIACEALIDPPDIDYCRLVDSWDWWGSTYSGKTDPALRMTGDTVHELKTHGLSAAIIMRFEILIDDDGNDVSVADIMTDDKYDDYYFVMIDFHH